MFPRSHKLISHSLSRSSSTDQILLASFEYDPSLPAQTQTFPVPADVVDLGIDIGIVIFRVESNFGGDFTCLYRVSRIDHWSTVLTGLGARTRRGGCLIDGL